ncbi:hypothetical protein [Aliarcobacter butzleri]|uniref:hypothetical protein n=1 Tax=Aliarcobacter butzleri TaxID=28197 RepID=UPI001269B6FA|nr:hypothetical protein [Aliarcobacter butzleri]
MNTYFVSYETVSKNGNINLANRRGWFTLEATLDEITQFNFVKDNIVDNIKTCENTNLDLKKESILILNISKLN